MDFNRLVRKREWDDLPTRLIQIPTENQSDGEEE